MKKRYLYLVLALCLSVLTIIGISLTMREHLSYASGCTAPAAVPDLVISVYAGDETILANETISFTIAYTNRLASSLAGVIVTGTLSPQQIYTTHYGYLSDPVISSEDFTYTGDFNEGYTLEWQLGDIAADAQGRIVVTTTVPLEAEPPWKASDRWPLLGMSAIMTTTTPNVSTGNMQGQEGDDASVMVVGPVLQITKVDSPDPARPGRLVTYTLIVENQDREDSLVATNPIITDVVPANTTFIHASGTGTYSPTSPTSGLVIWHLPTSLEKGHTFEVSFTARLTSSFQICPPPDIQNVGYQVSTDETIRLVTGKNERTDVDDVLEKSVRTSSPPIEQKEVFPGGMVTYTVSVYNPLHDETLTGLRLTDTLPGVPNPFSFTSMLNGSQPITTSPQIIWDGMSIGPGEVLSFTFGAWVPYHIDIGSGSKKYPNQLSASAEEVPICDMADKKPSEAKVVRQIILDKSVYPGHVLSGEIVTYTITLENVGKNDIADIRLTDTLPADFYYAEMVYGPSPEPAYRHNPVVWSDLTVPAYSRRSLVFRVVAIGYPLAAYVNQLSATSPWTTIPSISKAKVKIDSPFALNKTVDPGLIIVGEQADYAIRICNIATGTQAIDGIGDELHEGFYVLDAPHPYPERPYHMEHFPITPPIDLGPSDCYTYSFAVQVSLDVGCDNLPKTYWNQAGHVGFHVQDDPPALWYVNPKKIAPLDVVPHVTMQKVANHTAVLPGEMLVYTVTLHNNIASTISLVDVDDTLPGDGNSYFEYVEMVQGPAPVATATHVVRWEDLTIPPLGDLVLAFRVQVPGDITLGKYKNAVYADTRMATPICIQTIDPTAQVEVVKEIIELEKEASPEAVPPYGTVQYEISLKNKDSVPVTGIVVTDTLPQDFTFIDTVAGDPIPDEIDGRQVIWRDLTVPGDETLRLRFYVQAPVLYGLALNQVDAWCPRSQVITPEDPWDVKAPVNVLPGILIEKTVRPTATMAGTYVVYTITVHNESENYLENVLITDTLPTGFFYRPGGANILPIQTTPPVWVLNIGDGQIRQIVFEAGIRSCNITSGTHYNTVDGYSPSALIPGVVDAAPLKVAAADVPCVSLSASVSPTQTTNGGVVTYTIDLHNNSGGDFYDVFITHTLPAGFSFLEDLSSGPTLLATSPQVVWKLNRLSWGQSQPFVFRARPGFEIGSGVYSSTVEGTSSSIDIPRLTSVAPVTVTASTAPGVFLNKSVAPVEVQAGETVVYTITLKNQLDVTLEDIYITDTLPSGFRYLQMLGGPNPDLDASRSRAVWHVNQLNTGESEQLAFSAYVGCNLPTGVYSSALEGASFSAMVAGKEEIAPVQVNSTGAPCVDLYKTVSTHEALRGDTIVYTITIHNQSGIDLESLYLTDTLPTGFSYVNMLHFGTVPIKTSPQVVWDLSSLQDGSERQLAFEVQIAPSAALGMHYNALQGSSSPDYVLAVEGAAPVEVKNTLGDDYFIFLPLVLRNYE